MQRRSTPLAKTLGAAAPSAAAVSWVMTYTEGRTDVVWAPNAAANSAFDNGQSSFTALYVVLTWLLGVVLSVYATVLLRSPLRTGQRVLRKDAAAGGVHAIRVRVRCPVRETNPYMTGDRARRVATSSAYCVELVPEDDADRQRTIRLQAIPAISKRHVRISPGDRHLAHAALVGHGGWLCRPERWRESIGADPQRRAAAAFVSDSGHVVWGVTPDKDHRKYLRAGAAPVRKTDPALAVKPLTRPSRHIDFPRVHFFRLVIATAGALLVLPCALGVVPGWAGLPLSMAAGALALLAGVPMRDEAEDRDRWTVREPSPAPAR
ncbi:hypothetical protein [Streptomyces sp. NPDC048106]|uniref:hypothetical protein n=1 Tax=Streptomyces sp. NPDC048106 TaxID=3155750 RepID=UPI00345328B4